MKKIAITLIFLVIAAFLAFFAVGKLNKFEPVFVSDEVDDDIVYTEQCLLGQVFLHEGKILHAYIKEGEVYFDTLNVDTKTRTNLAKISKNELNGAKIEFPYIQLNPQYLMIKNKILVSFSPWIGKTKINKAFLYDIKSNKAKEVQIQQGEGLINIFALEGGDIVFYQKAKEGGLNIKISDINGNILKSKLEKNFGAISPLKNNKIIVSDNKGKPFGIYDVSSDTLAPLKKSAYGEKLAFITLQNGNPVFVTKEGEKRALELYDIQKDEFSTLVDNVENLVIEGFVGNKRIGNIVYARINGKYLAIDTINKTNNEIMVPTSENAGFPLDLGDEKILLNKDDGLWILDLTTAKAKKTKLIKVASGNGAYPINEGKTIIINNVVDNTFIFDRKTNSLTKGAKISDIFYRSYPMQVLTLPDGRILVHHSEIYSKFEKKYGLFGRLLDFTLEPLCEGAEEGICTKIITMPTLSKVVTEIR